jgi:hypothetical protein
MNILFKASILIALSSMIIPLYVGDDWELRKDKNGIKVYTRERKESNIYMYKVETTIGMSPEKVYRQAVDFRENLKYMDVVDSLAFLDHRKDDLYINYMRFDLPWPVKNREMVMNMKVKYQPGNIRLISNDAPGYLKSHMGLIQIEDFHEEWTIKTGRNANETNLTVIGWINPGGSIPNWVINMFSARTPFRFISGIIKELTK